MNRDSHRTLGYEVLAELLEDPGAWRKAADLEPEHFLTDEQRTIFATARTIAGQDGPEAAAREIALFFKDEEIVG